MANGQSLESMWEEAYRLPTHSHQRTRRTRRTTEATSPKSSKPDKKGAVKDGPVMLDELSSEGLQALKKVLKDYQKLNEHEKQALDPVTSASNETRLPFRYSKRSYWLGAKTPLIPLTGDEFEWTVRASCLARSRHVRVCSQLSELSELITNIKDVQRNREATNKTRLHAKRKCLPHMPLKFWEDHQDELDLLQTVASKLQLHEHHSESRQASLLKWTKECQEIKKSYESIGDELAKFSRDKIGSHHDLLINA